MKNEPPTHVLGLAHPPIPVVRIGLIGLGNRGLLTLERYMLIEHVEIKALCEIRPGNLAKGQTLLTKADIPPQPVMPEKTAGSRCVATLISTSSLYVRTG